MNMTKAGTDYVFKDKDLDRVFPLNDSFKSDIFTQLNQDINFFMENDLMDYTCLIGVVKVQGKSFFFG